MSSKARVALIPKFTRVEGSDDGVAAVLTDPVDVSALTAARIEFGRGPIDTANPGQAGFGLRIEESLDGKSWASCAHGRSGDSPDSIFEGRIDHLITRPWLRARVEFQGKAVTCWAEVVSA